MQQQFALLLGFVLAVENVQLAKQALQDLFSFDAGRLCLLGIVGDHIAATSGASASKHFIDVQIVCDDFEPARTLLCNSATGRRVVINFLRPRIERFQRRSKRFFDGCTKLLFEKFKMALLQLSWIASIKRSLTNSFFYDSAWNLLTLSAGFK